MAAVYGTPRVPRGVISRGRLTAALSTDAPLVVVRAPAGSGKTVAIADWANQLPESGVSGIWFTVDENSSSRLALWRGLLQTMHDAGLLPAEGVLATSYLSLGSSPDLRRLLTRGFTQLPHPLILIIDDLHLAEDPEIVRDLIALLKGIPQLRCIVSTRVRGELELDAVAIVLDTVLLETAELMFTVSETAQLIEAQGLSDTGGLLSQALHTAVGGLPITIRGVLLLMQRDDFDLDSDNVTARLEAAGADVLRDVWAMQVGDDRDIDFVILCSIPDSLDIELASRLTGREDAQTVLELAEAMGVGMWSDSSSGAMFTFTPVIRRELRNELARRFPHEQRELERTTAQWCFERGDFLAALRHAISADDFEIAERAIISDYRGFVRPHNEALRNILGGIPLHRLRKSPLVTMLLALALNASGRHKMRALEMFALAVVSARAASEKADPVRRTLLHTIESAAFRVTGQLGASSAAAIRAVKTYDELALEQKDQLTRLAPTLLNQAGLSLYYSGKTDQSLEIFQKAYALPTVPGDSGRIHALSLIAGVQAINGDLPEARELVAIARTETWSDGQKEGYLGALYQVAEGWLALEAGDFATAQSHVTVMEPHLETIEHWPLFMELRCMAMLGSGQAAAAVTRLSAALRRGARPSVTALTRSDLDATRALLYMATGQHRTAEKVLKRHPKHHPAIALQWVRLHLSLGKTEAARAALQPVAEDTLNSRLQSERLLLLASTSLRLAETEYALDTLDRAVALLNDRGLRMPLLLLPDADRELLAIAAADSGRSHALLHEFEGISLIPGKPQAAVVLTEREHVVLRALVTTVSAADIAAAQFVSVNTVKSQLRSLYRKLGASSREEALRRAGEHGLLES